MSAGADEGLGRIRRDPQPRRRRRGLSVIIGVLVVGIFLASRIATFYTDVLWFRSVGFGEVVWRQLGSQLGVGVVAALIATLIVVGNLLLARRLAPPYRFPTAQEAVIERYRELVLPFARVLLIGVGVLVGLLTGLALAAEWDTVALALNGGEFGRNDPHFGRDIGWFVFTLPLYQLVNASLSTVLTFTLVLTAVAHYVFGGIRPQAPSQRITPAANVHLSVLLAVFVGLRGWGFWISQYLLSYSERGQVTGLSYTDVNAQLPAYRLLILIAAVCVVLFLANIRYRNYLLPAAGVGILVVAAVLIAGVYPAVIQRLQVAPQELEREGPYIERNIELTRFGYDLDDVESSQFPANADLTADEVSENRATLESVRLWDPATLQASYQQLQALRPYYEFRDVDIDRYEIDGEMRQVLLGARELNAEQIPEQARTWQNQHLVYTHGYGYAASPSSGSTVEGQPLFVARDIPPEGEESVLVENPRIYFGENSPVYSVVGTEAQELDFPLESGEGASFERTTYDGEGGVDVGSLGRRLAFALRFGEPNLVLSGLIRSDSRILFNRNIKDQIAKVAPYLTIDHDPYAVAVDGRIKWVLDAYTTSNMVPYSHRSDLGPLTAVDRVVFQEGLDAEGRPVIRETVQQVAGIEGTANYIRNSVKAVVDAYDGTVDLYARDPEDPILQAWERVFPGSLTPVEEADPALRAHFRYPEDLFRVQSHLYTTYHMTEAADFYAKEDAWAIPQDAALAANLGDDARADQARSLRPYYLVLKLPGEESEEFALIQPFTPTGEQRLNLIGYLAGRSDPGVTGELRAFRFPPNRTVFGPEQVQARIDADKSVSEQITFWDSSGSRVVRGNLLVLPVGDSLLYVQPLFLQADQNSIPELKKVVVVHGGSIQMRDTLAESLSALFGEAVDVEPPGQPPSTGGDDDEGEPSGDEGTIDPRVAELVRQALERFAAAELALRAGDLGTYQEETAAAQELLEEADRIAGGSGAPTATETPTPAPSE